MYVYALHMVPFPDEMRSGGFRVTWYPLKPEEVVRSPMC